MNIFKRLDTLFPVGANRTSGEVVSIQLNLELEPLIGTLHFKRKAWYVNASVNAFHMHRGLIREISDLKGFANLSTSDKVKIKRLVTLSILNSYLSNRATGEQYHSYTLCKTWPSGSVRCWWIVGDLDWRVIADSQGQLYELASKYCDKLSARLDKEAH